MTDSKANSMAGSHQNRSQAGLTAWIVCLSCALFFFYEFIQMNMMGSLRPHLTSELSLSAQQLGWLDAAYFYANLLFLFPAGIILDRFSTKKVALITIGICILGTALFANATSFGWAVVFRFFTGIGSAFCFLSCMRLASVWFHQSRLALITGLIMTLAFLGGSVAQTPLTMVINAFGWRHALYLDAALGVLIFLIMAIMIRDYPSSEAALREKNKQKLESIGFWPSLRRSYLNGQNWLSGICTNMMNLPVFLLGAIWGSGFLMQTQHLTSLQASTSVMMIFIGTLIGSPTMGWLSDKIQHRKLPIFVGAFVSLLLLLLIIYVPGLSFTTYIALFFLLGLFSSAQIINYPLVAEKNTRVLTATSVSVVSFNVIGGGAIFPPFVGWLLDRGWDGSMIDKVPVYSLVQYHHAFIVLPLGLVLAMFLLLFMTETRAKPLD